MSFSKGPEWTKEDFMAKIKEDGVEATFKSFKLSPKAIAKLKTDDGLSEIFDMIDKDKDGMVTAHDTSAAGEGEVLEERNFWTDVTWTDVVGAVAGVVGAVAAVAAVGGR
eukprot:CAMPEP_0119302544 /NCGR_PEP_ID=MMETSP1333-20130426/4124_1 /TAXON_ID=418940 /ORGANISM="Scyphosphaera apsteinii, Strain RCC1455" /LENGTH=109 /DNA_ID=CAMNT_0007304933 /DNA_START=253 /DNA_END=582 /DNA_ORIENTATION=+